MADDKIEYQLEQIEKRLDAIQKESVPRELFDIFVVEVKVISEQLRQTNKFRWMFTGAIFLIPTVIGVLANLNKLLP